MNTLTTLPSLIRDLAERALPQLAWFRILRDPPKRTQEYTLILLPSLASERNETELPIWEKSTVEQDEPNLTQSSEERAEPQRVAPQTDNIDPNFV